MVMSDKGYLKLARRLAKKSNCKKIHYGTIIVKDGLVLGRGFNQPIDISGIDCCLRKNIKSGENLEQCKALHAEESSILNALELGFDIKDSILYLAKETPDGEALFFDNTLVCCSWCSRMCYSMKIKEVVVEKTIGIEHISIDDVVRLAYKKLGVVD